MSEMKKCPKCGHEVEYAFCTNCGYCMSELRGLVPPSRHILRPPEPPRSVRICSESPLRGDSTVPGYSGIDPEDLTWKSIIGIGESQDGKGGANSENQSDGSSPEESVNSADFEEDHGDVKTGSDSDSEDDSSEKEIEIDYMGWQPSPWKLRVFVGFCLVSILAGLGYIIWISVPSPSPWFQSLGLSHSKVVRRPIQATKAKKQASKRIEPRSPPPRNLVLKSPTYQGSVDNIFRRGRGLWWRSEYFSCVAVFGEDVSPTFIPGQLISRGQWRGWQYAELRGRGDRYLFLSVCGAGWNTYISEIPPDTPEHLGQAVVQDKIGIAYRAAPP